MAAVYSFRLDSVSAAAWQSYLRGDLYSLFLSVRFADRDDFELSEDESQERRLLWWEVASLEGWLVRPLWCDILAEVSELTTVPSRPLVSADRLPFDYCL
jgi:hypothetical protein